MPPAQKPAAMTGSEFFTLLTAVGITQKDAAARLGVSRRTIYCWIEEKVPISEEKAKLIRERITAEAT